MTLRSALWIFAALVIGATLGFFLLQRQLAGAWFALGVHPQVLAALEANLDDQKQLAKLDAAGEEAYRARFEELQALSNRLQILSHARRRILGRFELLLLTVSAGLVIAGAVVSMLRRSRDEARLGTLQTALTALSAGRTDIEVGERARDVIGRIGRMVEETSRRMARDRRRLRALRNLADWQEATRRHAHEMRTPLTAARLELDRLRGSIRQQADASAPLASLAEELDRLAVFARGFATFGRLPRPQLEPCDLVALARDLVETFADAWPDLDLVLELDPESASDSDAALGERVAASWPVAVDRDLMRQVLVNLWDNAARAVRNRPDPEASEVGRQAASGAKRGRVRVTAWTSSVLDEVGLDVTDNGGGVAESVRDRLFTPYVTAYREEGGSGLGLAISKKILLDHGGDLDLHATGPAGTTFRLTLPRQEGPGQEGPRQEEPRREGHSTEAEPMNLHREGTGDDR